MFGTDQNEDCSSPSSSGQGLIQVYIASMIGQQWTENISENETVQMLKNRIWRRCGLLPYHQGLIYGEKSLPSGDGRVLLKNLGIRPGSVIRLVLVTRSGPLAIQHTEHPEEHVDIEVNEQSCPAVCWNGKRNFDEEFLEENKRTLFKMCELRRQMRAAHSYVSKPATAQNQSRQSSTVSAPEDTSAKESSAGETECDDEATRFSSSEQVLKNAAVLVPISSRSNFRKDRHTAAVKSETYEDECISNGQSSGLSAKDRLLVLMHSRPESPAADVNGPSEDGSEFSSGMITCDLTNEFRRLRVRRRHHLANGAGTTAKAHVKNKSKVTPGLTHQHKGSSDVTSSDDDLPSLRRTLDNNCANTRGASCLPFRRPPATSRAQKLANGYQSQHRCYTCASRLSSCSIPFHCRCGKRLCARHRPADMHTCPRVRKMQDVSD